GEGRTSTERGEHKPRDRGDRQRVKSSSERGGRDRGGPQSGDAELQPMVTITGVFEPGSGGGGRLRTDLGRRVRGDADVQRGEVRKWRLRRGDIVTGEARKTKRGRTDFQLVGVTAVNGQDSVQRSAERVRFDEAEAAGTGDRFAKRLFKHAPVGAGSRAVITGPTRAAASQMIAQLADELAGSGVTTALVITVARPEDAARPASGYDVLANEAGKPAESILPAIELALQRGMRLAESGGNAAVLVDGLDLLPADRAAEILGAARNLTLHGSLTVVGSAGAGSALEAQATTIAVVSGGRRLKIDKKASWSTDR
ncbi:MAG: hypothetical protein WAO61_10670, partial [Solirubrobacterales bacterium]